MGGFIIEQEKVNEYIKDLGKYRKIAEDTKNFDISHWAFFIAFDENNPIGAVTIVSKTATVHILDGRNDLAVLWDLREKEGYKHMGVGQNLFNFAVDRSKRQGLKQLKTECQNNNVPACNFYHKQGSILSQVDEYAHYLQ